MAGKSLATLGETLALWLRSTRSRDTGYEALTDLSNTERQHTNAPRLSSPAPQPRSRTCGRAHQLQLHTAASSTRMHTTAEI